MIDYLTFKKFISTKALIFFYYLFAVTIPIMLLFAKNKLFEINFIKNSYLELKDEVNKNLTFNQKLKIFFILFFCLIMCEIFLRMFFEFLIAYIQIRDVLVNG